MTFACWRWQSPPSAAVGGQTPCPGRPASHPTHQHWAVGSGGWLAPRVGFHSQPQLTRGPRKSWPLALGDPPPLCGQWEGPASARLLVGPQTVLHGRHDRRRALGLPRSLPRWSLHSDGGGCPRPGPVCRHVLTTPLPRVPTGGSRSHPAGEWDSRAHSDLAGCAGPDSPPLPRKNRQLWSPLLMAAGAPTAPLSRAPPASLTRVTCTGCRRWSVHRCVHECQRRGAQRRGEGGGGRAPGVQCPPG